MVLDAASLVSFLEVFMFSSAQQSTWFDQASQKPEVITFTVYAPVGALRKLTNGSDVHILIGEAYSPQGRPPIGLVGYLADASTEECTLLCNLMNIPCGEGQGRKLVTNCRVDGLPNGAYRITEGKWGYVENGKWLDATYPTREMAE